MVDIHIVCGQKYITILVLQKFCTTFLIVYLNCMRNIVD